MDAYNEHNFSGKALDYLDLVADKINDLNIISFIDERLPLSESSASKLSMEERIAGMILNGLGFIDT
jgi:transposase